MIELKIKICMNLVYNFLNVFTGLWLSEIYFTYVILELINKRHKSHKDFYSTQIIHLLNNIFLMISTKECDSGCSWESFIWDEGLLRNLLESIFYT